MPSQIRLFSNLIFYSIIVIFAFFVFSNEIQAAQLNRAYLRLDRMRASTATGGTVCAMWNTTAPTDAKIKITFPTGFTVNGTAGNWTVTTTNLPVGASAMPGIGTATAVSGQTVTFPISNVTSDSTLYCFNFSGTSTLTTGTAGNDKTGVIEVTQSDDSPIDFGSYATAIVADDQISITATVPSTFSISFSTNSQSLGTLTTSGVTSGTGVAITFLTNAANGWISWVRSANAGLDSSTTGHTINTTGTINGTPSSLSAGTEGYVLDADLTNDSGSAGSGTVTVNGEYNGGDTNSGGTLSTLFSEFASANGPTDGDIITIIPRVSISGLTPAASDYTDTLTIVAAGVF